MNTHALLAITTTVAAASALVLPVVDCRPRSTTPAATSIRPHVSVSHQRTAPAVPCAPSWRLDPAGRHWLMPERWREYDACAARHRLERARQLEHDPLR
jgi:hypothetical protein